jgi:quercetin dioxygenase-like cupin family protein
MKLENLPAAAIDWPKFPSSTLLGESGTAITRVRELGNVQLRLVDFSRNYVAGHWCHKGHVMFVVSGQVVIEHKDGPKFTLRAGMSYHVPDEPGSPHRITSKSGASLFIVE